MFQIYLIGLSKQGIKKFNSYFETNGGGGVAILGSSVDRVLFSLYPGSVFLEVDIIWNIVFLIVD